jgi:threonine efflux protein
MIENINLPLILLAALIAMASPGPATLAIAGTSMNSGRRYGLAIAAGITSGSLIWSISAALGLGALMLTNLWAVELMRYFGASYLLYLAYKSARSALTISQSSTQYVMVSSKRAAFAKGLALHLTNPKAIFFFGSLFAIGVPPDSPPASLAIVIAAVGLQSLIIFHGYALLFSSELMITGYAKLRRWFEAIFAIAFGAAGLKILTARLD